MYKHYPLESKRNMVAIKNIRDEPKADFFSFWRGGWKMEIEKNVKLYHSLMISIVFTTYFSIILEIDAFS